MSFEQDWTRCQQLIEEALDQRLPPAHHPPAKLHEAMRYSTLNGGKRFRAVLVVMVGEMLGVEARYLMTPAVAVECMHTYSLIHDDLPCMDDDDFRRGMPCCHKKYDEATAVLAGNALQAFAFQILSSEKGMVNSHRNAGKLVAVLSEAVGSTGLIGGQIMDIEYENSESKKFNPIHINLLKTAKLIQVSVQLGALMSDSLQSSEYDALSAYGENIGQAFQLADDILDDDSRANNPKQKAEAFRDVAISELQQLDYNTENLQRIAHFVVSRSF